MLSSILISMFGKRVGLAFAKVLPYLLAVLFVVVVGWLIYYKGYDRGVEVTEQKYQTAIAKERHRQIEANDMALQEALKRQAELEQLLEERDAAITDLLDEATQDPGADRPAIGADSVRRLNRIR